MLNNFIDHLAFNECQSFVAAQVRIGELVLVQPQLMENGGVHVPEVTGLFDGVKADGVGRADNLSAFDAAAAHKQVESPCSDQPMISLIGPPSSTRRMVRPRDWTSIFLWLRPSWCRMVAW